MSAFPDTWRHTRYVRYVPGWGACTDNSWGSKRFPIRKVCFHLSLFSRELGSHLCLQEPLQLRRVGGWNRGTRWQIWERYESLSIIGGWWEQACSSPQARKDADEIPCGRLNECFLSGHNCPTHTSLGENHILLISIVHRQTILMWRRCRDMVMCQCLRLETQWLAVGRWGIRVEDTISADYAAACYIKAERVRLVQFCTRWPCGKPTCWRSWTRGSPEVAEELFWMRLSMPQIRLLLRSVDLERHL